MTGVPTKCPHCGAQLPLPTPGQSFLQCVYCGNALQVSLPPPPVTGFGGGPTVEAYRNVTRTTTVSPYVYALPIGLVFVSMMISFGAQMASRSSGTTSAAGDVGAGPGSGGVTMGEHLQWDSQEAPLPARVNGDAIEDFVGRYRVLDGSKSPVFIGGFDGTSLRRVWAAGPYGDASSGGQAIHFTVAGSKVLVTDPRSIAHVLDVTTGKETAAVTLSDRANAVCGNPDRPEAWVEVSDEQHVLVDLAAGSVKKAPRPPWCPGDSSGISDIQCRVGLHKSHARCQGVDSSFKAPSFRGERALVEGDVMVVVGEKSPGTRVPTAVGVDPKTKAVKWQRAIPQGDPNEAKEGLGLVDLGNGRLVAQFELAAGGFKLAAIDAHTGRQLWETAIPRSRDGSEASLMTISSTRVYLPHWTWLDVFDARTGAVIGTVGKW